MKLEYYVVVPDELGAGIRGLTDEITVEIKDRSPDRETIEAATEHFRCAIREWYGSGRVYSKKEFHDWYVLDENEEIP